MTRRFQLQGGVVATLQAEEQLHPRALGETVLETHLLVTLSTLDPKLCGQALQVVLRDSQGQPHLRGHLRLERGEEGWSTACLDLGLLPVNLELFPSLEADA